MSKFLNSQLAESKEMQGVATFPSAHPKRGSSLSPGWGGGRWAAQMVSSNPHGSLPWVIGGNLLVERRMGVGREGLQPRYVEVVVTGLPRGEPRQSVTLHPGNRFWKNSGVTTTYCSMTKGQ